MADDFRSSYQQFIEEVLTHEIVWALESDDGIAICQSVEFDNIQVLPFWSLEKLARVACIGDWGGYQPTPIHFDDFIDAWLHGMQQDQHYAGINWNKQLEGVEIEPIRLMDDLLEA